MGRDKALMEWNGRPLVLHVAEAVAQAAYSATLVGSRERGENPRVRTSGSCRGL